MSTRLDPLRQPEYIGENRCTPCTVVNVCIAALLAVAVGVAFPLAGVVVFVLSLAAIYLRGYLVPGTPTLTKRYFPDRVLALFDKEPASTDEFVPAADAATGHGGADSESPSVEAGHGATPGTPDATVTGADPETASSTDPADDADAPEPDIVPEQLLGDLDVVEPCESVDDLCLTEAFERSWLDATEQRRDDVLDPDLLAPLFDADAERIEVTDNEESVVVEATGVGRQRWLSTGALLADATANERLLAEHDRWAALAPHQRLPILKALRSFLPTCPLCEGSIEMGEETVESCCRSWEVVAVACNDCEQRYLEVDAKTIEGAVE